MLLGLTALVLLAHLWGLLGGLPLWLLGGNAPKPRLEDALPPTSPQASTTGTPPDMPDVPLPVDRSTVRWVVLVQPQPDPPQPPPEVRRLRPKPVPEPVAEPAEPTEPALPEPALPESEAPPPVEPPPAIAPPEPPATPPPPQEPERLAQPEAPQTLAAETVTEASNLLPSAGNLGEVLSGSTELRYDVIGLRKGLNYSARSLLSWQHDAQTYSARTEVSAFLLGSRSQLSTGRLGAGGLMPERFTDKSRTETAAHFDTVTGRIRYSRNTPDVPLLPGAQDRVSVILQLGLLLNTRPDGFPPGQRVRVPVSNTTTTEVWQFEVEAQENLSLPAGTVMARKLVRSPRKEFDQRVEIWLAPALRHLPVRIRITDANGDFVDQLLRELPPQIPPPSAESAED